MKYTYYFPIRNRQAEQLCGGAHEKVSLSFASYFFAALESSGCR